RGIGSACGRLVQDGRSTGRNGSGNVLAPVVAPARHRDEDIARTHCAAVGGQAGIGRAGTQPIDELLHQGVTIVTGLAHMLSFTGSAGNTTCASGASGATRSVRSESPAIRANTGAAT